MSEAIAPLEVRYSCGNCLKTRLRATKKFVECIGLLLRIRSAVFREYFRSIPYLRLISYFKVRSSSLSSVCPSVCLCVTKCIVAKQYCKSVCKSE